MVKITVIFEDDNLDFKAVKEALGFEAGEEAFDKIESAYKRRVEMELK